MDWRKRFWLHVDKQGSSECWLWTAYVNQRGYGHFQRAPSMPVRAHRVAWELTYGKIPLGKLVCHTCDTRRCCNPSHLWLGTPKENTADMVKKGRAPKGAVPGQIPRKLSWEKARAIRALLLTTSCKELAQRFGVASATIYKIKINEIWTE